MAEFHLYHSSENKNDGMIAFFKEAETWKAVVEMRLQAALIGTLGNKTTLFFIGSARLIFLDL